MLDILFGGDAQLRLSYDPNGINTDFQTISTGDLVIYPNNGGVNRYVGINTGLSGGAQPPANTLEIDANPAVYQDYTTGHGLSGLTLMILLKTQLLIVQTLVILYYL